MCNLSISIPDIVRSFVQEGVDVMDAHLCEDTLEDYFKKVTGGEGIAWFSQMWVYKIEKKENHAHADCIIMFFPLNCGYDN